MKFSIKKSRKGNCILVVKSIFFNTNFYITLYLVAVVFEDAKNVKFNLYEQVVQIILRELFSDKKIGLCF